MTRLDSTSHHKTKNAKGFMHPVTGIGRKFALFSSKASAVAGIHASLVLPYLTEEELDQALLNFYDWLKPEGKLFILYYTIFIKELVNPCFEAEYKKRKEEESCKLEPLENPFGPKVLPMSPGWTLD